MMINDFLVFRKDITKANPIFKIWGPLLNFSLIIGGLYFYNHLEGILITLTTLLSLIIVVNIHKKLPLARIMGVCHVVWLPLYPFLFLKIVKEGISNEFHYFLVWSVLLMTISIGFDCYDFYRYVFTDNKTYEK